jgi:hypothetical protein
MKFELKTNPWEEAKMGYIYIYGKRKLDFFFEFFFVLVAQIQSINFANFVGKLTKCLR